MIYSKILSIGIYLSWRFKSSGGDRECYRIGIILNDILFINLFHIEDGLGGIFLLDPKVNVVLTIFYLSELSIKDYINIKFRDKSNLF
jgi:hypothetical protein